MQASKFTIDLEVLAKLGISKSEINQFSQQLNAALKSINPEIEISTDATEKDLTKLLSGVAELQSRLSELENISLQMDAADINLDDVINQIKTAMHGVSFDLGQAIEIDPTALAKEMQYLQKTINGLQGCGVDIPIKSAGTETLVKDLSDATKQTENFLTEQKKVQKALADTSDNGGKEYKELSADISATEKQLKELSGVKVDLSDAIKVDASDVKADLQEVEKVTKNINIGKVDIPITSTGADAMKNEIASAVEETKELLTEQKKSQQKLAESGKTGSKEYQQLAKEIAESEDKLKDLAKAADDANDATQKITFADKLANVGLSIQGVTELAEAVGQLTAPFVQLDTATRKIETLGGAAKENSSAFREMALELSQSVPISAPLLQTATYDALSAGIKATEKDIGAFMSAASKLAVGGSEEVGNTVNLLSSMVNAYGESAEQTSAYSDILFQTVNLGKTSITELSGSLSNVIPTAAAMGYSLKDVGAALALMTANGIPTAQATTKLNQLMVEMQKPGTDLAAILSNVGVSAESLSSKIAGGDVVGALGDMKMAFDTAGKSATQAFSSTEAASAFNVLTKDMQALTDTTNQFANSTGLTEDAFNTMSGSIENRAAAMKTKIETSLIGLADMGGVFGELALVATQSVTQLTPFISAATGLKSLFGGMASSIFKTVSGLLAHTAATAAGTVATTAETAATAGLTVAQTAGTAATAAATTATTGLGAAIMATPIGWILAGIAAVVVAIGGVIALIDWLIETDEEHLEGLESQNKALEEQENLYKKQSAGIEANKKLIAEYEELGKKTSLTAEEQKRFDEVQVQIAKNMPGTISAGKSYAENMEALRGKTSELNKELEDTNNKLAETQDKKISIDYQINTTKIKMAGEELEDVLDLDFAENQELKVKIDNIKVEKDPAKQQQMMQDLKMQVFNSDEFGKLDGDEQKKVEEYLKNIETAASGQMEAYAARMKADAGKLGKAIAEGTMDFGDVDTDAAIKKIADETGKSIGEVTAEVKNKTAEIRDAGFNDALVSAFEVKKGQIAADGLDELVSKYENAQTAMEKQNFAEQIKQSAPEAVKWIGTTLDENGKLINQYEIEKDKIDDAAAAELERTNGKGKDALNSFIGALRNEGKEYTNNENKMKELSKTIEEQKSMGIDTSETETAYKKLQAQNQNYIDDLLENAVKWEETGQSMDAVAEELAKTLGKSPDEIKKMIEGFKSAKNAAGGVASASETIAAKLKDAQAATNKNLNDAVSALAGNIAGYGELSKEERDLEIQRGRDAVKEQKRQKRAQEQAERMIGLGQQQTANKKDAVELAEDEFKTVQARNDIELKQFETALKVKQLNEDRQKTDEDDLLLAEKKRQIAESELNQYVEILKNKKLISGISADGTIQFAGKLKTSTKLDIEKQLADLNSSVADAGLNVVNLQAKISTSKEKLKEEIRKLTLEGYQLDIDAGVNVSDNYDKLIAAYNLQGFELKKQMETDLQNVQLTEDEKTRIRLNAINEIKETDNKIATLKEKQRKASEDAAKETSDKQIERDKKATEQLQSQINALKTLTNAYNEAKKKQSETNYTASTEKLNEETEKQKAILQQQHEDGILSETEYNKRIEEVDKEHQKKSEKQAEEHRRELLRLSAASETVKEYETALLEIERLKKLEEQKENLTIQLAIATEQGDTDAAAGIIKQLDDTRAAIEEKADLIKTQLGEKLGGALSESITAMFSGDAEGTIDSWRKYFAQLGEYLKREISAFVLRLVLSESVTNYLASLPFPLNVAAIPAIKATVTGAVNAIASPVLNALTSFASGGRVDSPTLAIIGDGAKLGNSNREWIFRDDQLQQTIQMANELNNSSTIKRLDKIEKLLASQELTTTLKGSDIYISQRRTAAGINGRAR